MESKRIFHTQPGERLVGQRTIWDYNHIREYLLALGRGENFLESIDRYPEEISLSSVWHEMFNEHRMRAGREGREYYSSIGVSNQRRSLVLQAIPVPGETHSVSGLLILDQRSRATRLAGADVILGDLHSHPIAYEWNYGGLKGIFSTTGHFSPGDLYSLVGSRHDLISCLVHGDENLIMFRSRESEYYDSFRYLPFLSKNRDQFCHYWLKNQGLAFFPKTQSVKKIEPNGEELEIFPEELLQVNINIAKYHQLALYKGKVNKNLRRISP